VVVPLRRPTDDTLALAKAAADGMRSMYLPGYLFTKAGVILVDLQSADLQQGELDLDDAQPDEQKRGRSRLMLAMDAINMRYGKGTVESAATGRTGPPRLWEMTQERKTPQYTTRIEDMPLVRA
jgi:DNA polymerase V